jgi:hypothetical protein
MVLLVIPLHHMTGCDEIDVSTRSELPELRVFTFEGEVSDLPDGVVTHLVTSVLVVTNNTGRDLVVPPVLMHGGRKRADGWRSLGKAIVVPPGTILPAGGSVNFIIEYGTHKVPESMEFKPALRWGDRWIEGPIDFFPNSMRQSDDQAAP